MFLPQYQWMLFKHRWDVPFCHIAYGNSVVIETIFVIICEMFPERMSLNLVLLLLLLNLTIGLGGN